MNQREHDPFGSIDDLDLNDTRDPHRRGDDDERPGRRRGPGRFVVVLIIAGAALAGWWALRDRAEVPSVEPVATAPAAPVEEPAIAPLPPREEQDSAVRDALASLSGDAALARWLQAGDLVRRFVGAVAATAEGHTPASHFRGVLPQDSFEVRRRAGNWVAHPRSYAAYAPVVKVFTSFDPGAAAKAYATLEPLFDSAYREIGRPGARFRHTLGKAIDHLVATPVPASSERVELVESGIFYAYADPRLESLSRAQKQLLRMGPDNARRIQDHLRQIATALDLGREAAAIR